MACTLAESPSDPLHRKLRQLRCLHCRFDCYRVERTSSRAGVAPAEVQRLFTAHFFANLPSRLQTVKSKNPMAAIKSFSSFLQLRSVGLACGLLLSPNCMGADASLTADSKEVAA